MAVLSQNNCMHRDGTLVDGSRGGGGIVCVEAAMDFILKEERYLASKSRSPVNS